MQQAHLIRPGYPPLDLEGYVDPPEGDIGDIEGEAVSAFASYEKTSIGLPTAEGPPQVLSEEDQGISSSYEQRCEWALRPQTLSDLEAVLHRDHERGHIYLRLMDDGHLSRLSIRKEEILRGYGALGKSWLKAHPWDNPAKRKRCGKHSARKVSIK